jgi:atlastin
MSAEAVQIVEIEEEKNVFRLNEEALASVLARVPPDSKVAVVAVAGAFRTGKSFLLDLFLRYLRAGTEVTATVRTSTARRHTCSCC